MAGEVATLSPGLLPASQSIPHLEERPKATATNQEASRLKIDTEFKGLIPPLTSSELKELKESLSVHGCRDKLVIWRNTLLDGHHRYQICQEKGIRFETREIELSSRSDAKIWILKNQRGRRNLSESQRAMLALKLEKIYGEKAKENAGTRTDLGQNLGQGEGGRSAEKAAKDMGISHQTVTYAKKVTDKGVPELVKMVEHGDVAVSSAAKVASQPTAIQNQIVERVTSLIEEGKKPKMISLLHEIAPPAQETSVDISKCLNRLKKNLEANWGLVERIEIDQRPENLAEMVEIADRIAARLREIASPTSNPS